MNFPKKPFFLFAFILGFQVLFAQTPIANRVRMAAKKLPEKSEIVAKYTDNKRHSLYYIFENRLYCVDVYKNRIREVQFSNRNYERIRSWRISPSAAYMLFIVDKGRQHRNENDRFELWRLNSFDRKSKCLDTGYRITRSNEEYIVTKRLNVINPDAPKKNRKWLLQDYSYDMEGNTLFRKEAYKEK